MFETEFLFSIDSRTICYSDWIWCIAWGTLLKWNPCNFKRAIMIGVNVIPYLFEIITDYPSINQDKSLCQMKSTSKARNETVSSFYFLKFFWGSWRDLLGRRRGLEVEVFLSFSWARIPEYTKILPWSWLDWLDWFDWLDWLDYWLYTITTCCSSCVVSPVQIFFDLILFVYNIFWCGIEVSCGSYRKWCVLVLI
jgi:hypothetical protein